MMTRSVGIFQRPAWVATLALLAAVAWGWAYPLIKLGFEAFAIEPSMTASKMLFAGVRFFISGLIILVLARGTHRSFAIRSRGDWAFVIAFSLLNTTLHYAFFYFGLSHSAGSRAAILNSLGTFLVVLLACAFFKSDKLSTGKLAGCAIGFAGIVALNLGGTSSSDFSLLGDGMIVLNALCSAFASLMTRGLGRRMDVFVGTGYSLAIGGALLVVPALAMEGSLPRITPSGLLYLALLIAISTVAFAIYNKLLSCNPVGKVAIFNSLIPVVGAVSSCLCLAEPFYAKYALAGTLAATGIFIINKGKH